MGVEQPDILALDFDGVVCDGLIEYFQTAWQAYCQVWQPGDRTPPAGLAEQFYRLRPVVETGWEMPVVLRSLLQGTSEEAILANWGAIAQTQIQTDQKQPEELAAAVDGVRDQWIAADLEDWLGQHRFYPGVIERLQQILEHSADVRIVTTKEGRFVKQLLHQAGVELEEAQIFGKEVKQPKHQTLRSLLQQSFEQTGESATLWFVEDRLKTLKSVATQEDLQTVQLFLADWGYNTVGDRQIAQDDNRIHLISLKTFAQEFPNWLPSV